MNALTSGCIRRETGRKSPRVSGTVSASPTRCSSDDAAAPPGWTPCVTIGNWFGSPISTIDRAQVPIATALASDIWLASSTNRTSKAPSNSGRANSQPVPATMSTVRASSAAATSGLVPTRVTPSR